MASLVTRTVTTFKLSGRKLYWNAEANKAEISEPVSVELVNVRKPSEEKAKLFLSKQYGNGEYINVTIEESSVTYGIEFDKFMEIAHVVERAPSQRKDSVNAPTKPEEQITNGKAKKGDK